MHPTTMHSTPRASTRRLAGVAAVTAMLLAAAPAMANPSTERSDERPGAERSTQDPRVTCDARTDDDRTTPAIARRYVVASAHPAASAAGCAVLAGRGTAADAAVAVQAVLAVVEPQSSGLAGGTVMTYYDRSRNRVRFFDGLARAPGRTTAGLRTPTIEEQQQLGIDSFGSDTTYTARAVGVPGTLAVLDLVHDEFGHVAWSRLFDQGIRLADDGFEVAPYLADTMAGTAGGLARCGHPDLARYCDGDQPLPVGATVTNPALADVLAEVRDGGAEAFYDPNGSIAPALVDRLAQGSYKLDADADGPAEIPSLMTVDDVDDYRAIERDPLCQAVLERWICSAPPPSFGGVAVLSMLEYLERGDVAATAPTSLERMHLAIEASRLVQFDRREYVGDPDFQFVPTAGLLDEDYLDTRFSLFSPDAALPAIEPGTPPAVARPDHGNGIPVRGPHTDADTTSNVSIVDRFGDALSMTTTINSSFGAQIEARGMALNNVQENFTRPDSISPGQQVNQMESDKRPRTSIAPSLVFDRRGRVELVVGAAGGGAIPDYVAQAILGVVVDGMDPQEAINQGHWSGQAITSRCPGMIGARSELEEGTEVASLLSDLVALGHPCARLDDLRSGSTAIEVVSPRRLLGAADPRRDGAAIGD